MDKKNTLKKNLPMIVVILDGWGLSQQAKGNAISLAKTPTMDSLLKKFPNTRLYAHGKHVGLPSHQDGNSEAGHMNIGAGRIVEQDIVKISKSINDGTFSKNAAFLEAINNAKENKKDLHLLGLLSNGMSAHSDPDHILALISMAKTHGIKNVYLHLFTDGRDSPQYASLHLVENLQRILRNGERIATIMGRFYAMDRKKKWERTKAAYEALVLGKGRIAESACKAINESYNRKENDEFIPPYVIVKKGDRTYIKNSRIKDGDSIIFFNLRSDRARQLSKALIQKNFNKDNKKAFKRSKVLNKICFVTMTDFGPDLDSILSAFPSKDLKNTLPQVLSGFRQLYLAEREKYAHVTYFLNGGYSGKVDKEDQKMIESPDVKSYDKTPAMNSKKITTYILQCLNKNKYDFVLVNYAAPDMIGHTGNLKAGIKCCEEIDKQIKRITEAYKKKNGTVVITADHGNIEEMVNLETGEIDTEHSTNNVPFIIVSKGKKIKLLKEGNLSNIAPTILELLSKEKPKEMKSKSLIR